MATNDRNDLALFIDFENIALGLKDRKDQAFDIQKVLERLLTKGKIIVKRAYADWSRFSSYTRSFHEAAIELIEIPRRRSSGKNSADIRLCVDAMDLCYAKEHISTFVIVSGDSDFSPLVSKLRENGKQVLGLGLRGSTSGLLVSNCDEFIYYEAIVESEKSTEEEEETSGAEPKQKDDILEQVAATVAALVRDGRDHIQPSLVKDTFRRKHPSFSEGDHGYRTFTELLEDAQTQKLISLREDERSGTHLVSVAERRSRPRRRKKTTRKTTPKKAADTAES